MFLNVRFWGFHKNCPHISHIIMWTVKSFKKLTHVAMFWDWSLLHPFIIQSIIIFGHPVCLTFHTAHTVITLSLCPITTLSISYWQKPFPNQLFRNRANKPKSQQKAQTVVTHATFGFNFSKFSLNWYRGQSWTYWDNWPVFTVKLVTRISQELTRFGVN